MLGLLFWVQTKIIYALPSGLFPANETGHSLITILDEASSTSNDTSVDDGEEGDFMPSIRAVETAIAVLSTLLLTITYAILIGPGVRLSSTSKLPLAAIEGNIGNLLSKTWPDTSNSADLETTEGEFDAIRLFYVGKMENDKERVARGILQCEAHKDNDIDTPPMWLTTGSSLTRSMVELAVWEWVSLWMAVAMVSSTLTFNGFFSNDKDADSYPRLVIIIIYTAAYCFHAWYVWRVCKRFFTLLGAGATWSMLNKANFASVDLVQLQSRLKGDGPSPVFKQVGKPASSPGFPAIDAFLAHENAEAHEDSARKRPADAKHERSGQRGALETLNDWQRAEISSTVEAGRTALKRIIANIMNMIGIIIASGFSVWTPKADIQNSQLGSLALLASLALGTGAMFTSAVYLSVMETSFRNLLFLKEIMINGKESDHVEKRSSKGRVLGFTHGTVEAQGVRTRDLVKMCTVWGFLLFGPVYALLPSKADHTRQTSGADFELHVTVRGKPIILTTGSTDRHGKGADGRNLEPINVCYNPQAKPIAEDPKLVQNHVKSSSYSETVEEITIQ